MAMRRILVHAGFYKTGTTSLQAQLARLADALEPYFHFYGPGALQRSGALAREFARSQTDESRRAFRRSFKRFAEALPDTGNIVISRENFAGIMPGHRGVDGEVLTGINPAARMLARDIRAGLERRFGDQMDLHFLYSVRDRTDWLKSVHGHQLRSTGLRDDLVRFSELFPNNFDLRKDADKVAQALAPTPVHIRALEDYRAHPQGPAAMVLDLMDVPQEVIDTLPPAERQNAGQDAALRAEFLRLNRLGMDRTALHAAKHALLPPDPSTG
ncbi:hypothetical protein TM5383_00765 [Thalassovita mediterranea]|jgi:hypothetical protein|uniref:Sulfotransferase family protein n=2 Tax=Thalassovita mediterranea TaxID=340021 RepID=A0A0P1GMU1_9RHOB|nr:hypothetical protein TM5383_00765 [Thalassovita mediterranea]SIS34421.1 hypothetical protein SAMN05421685_11130 [Thalassovita mediterranea]